MSEVIKRFLDIKVVSFISDEYFTFWAMFVLGRDDYINDDCAVVCYAIYYI